MQAAPTIKDVAKAAGVHFTTVSLALRGHRSIPAVTRDRIVAAAARIGYRKDMVFSALSSRRSKGVVSLYTPKVAFLHNRSPENGYSKLAHFRRAEEAARQQAETMGYRFETLFVDEGYHDSTSLLHYLRSNEVRGLLFCAFEPGRRTVELPWDEFSIVKFNSRHLAPPATNVGVSQGFCVKTAFRKLHQKGYRRIGLAVGLQDEIMTENDNVANYVRDAEQLTEGAIIPPLLFPYGATAKIAIPMIKEWVVTHQIDAVMCNWTNIRSMLASCGFQVPNDVACACLCLDNHTSGTAGVVTHLDQIAQQAMIMLATLMRAERRGIPALATDTHVEGIWRDGATAPVNVAEVVA